MRILLCLVVACAVVVSACKYNPELNRKDLERLSHAELVDRVLAAHGASSAAPQYWWKYENADCANDDVPGSCLGKSIDECKALCLSTTGCGGFNTDGFLKKTDCLTHKKFSTICDLYVLEDSPAPGTGNMAFPPMWPHPQTYTNGTTTLAVDPTSWKFSAATTSPDLEAAFTRYLPLLFTDPVANKAGYRSRLARQNAAVIKGMTVTVTDPKAELQLGANESYSLSINTDGTVLLMAPTQFGAYHGLETFSQMLRFDYDQNLYVIDSAPWSVIDAPRFSHREVLIDTARHYLPIATLKRVIDSLTYAKVNVVHWHLVDSQSFPFDSPSRPLLSKAGAWSSRERFTTEDVAAVVEHARARGVRMVVEIDGPGHAASWCKGYPEICPAPDCPQPLNPAVNATFDVLHDLYFDLTGGKRGAGLFFDNIMHLGGDEVNTDCWTNTPAVADWLKEKGFTADQAYMYFVQRAQKIAQSMGRDVVGWEEIWNHFGTQLAPETIIQQWLPGSSIAVNATAHGYRVIWSTDGVWYLDGLGVTWDKMYEQEPCTGIDDKLCEQYVLGGGGEMWGETVDTGDVLFTIWPRMGAIAERLWSPRDITDKSAALPRIMNFRCLLNRRGISAAPVDNSQARTAPPGPGSCFAQ